MADTDLDNYVLILVIYQFFLIIPNQLKFVPITSEHDIIYSKILRENYINLR